MQAVFGSVHGACMSVRVMSCAAVILATAAAAVVVEADPTYDGPFRVRNAAPAAIPFGLPRAAGGALLESGYELGVTLELARSDAIDRDGSALAAFTGDTVVLTYGYRRALSPRVEWFVDLPYVAHQSGAAYRVGGSDATVVVDGTTRRAGDVRTGIGYRLRVNKERAVAARLQLKLPTGSAVALTGSEGADLAFWVELTEHAALARWRLTATASGGMAILGDGALIPGQQRRTAWFGQAGLSYPLSPTVSARIQVDAHERLFTTRVRPLGRHAVYGALGVRWQPLPRLWADLLFVDALRADTAPDRTLQMTLGARL
jgi:hypothetical protein